MMRKTLRQYVIVAILVIMCIAAYQFTFNRTVEANLAATLLAYGQTLPPYNPIKRPSPAIQDIIEGQYQIYLQDKAEMEWDIAWVTAQAAGYQVLQSDGQRVDKDIWIAATQLHVTSITDHLAKLDTHK